MPPAAKRQKTTKSKPTITPFIYVCEWSSCHSEHEDIDALIKHVCEHLTEHLQHIEDFALSLPEELKACPWTDCDYVSDRDVYDFQRHIYFHCFHIKIKGVGKRLLEAKGMAGCQLGAQSRNTIPELPERLLCGWQYCQSVYDNPEYFYRHVLNHAEVLEPGNNIKNGCLCEWEGCELVTKSKHKLKDHIRSHTQEKVVSCPTCGGLFANNTKFLDHIKRQVEVELQSYQCSHCNKQFHTERLLRDHMRLHVNHYKCPHCDMTCPAPSGLQRHILYKHNDDKPYMCNVCNHLSKTHADLRKHMERHNEASEYKCTVAQCSFTCRCYYSLARHFRRRHRPVQMTYLCHVCNREYKLSKDLTSHLKKKHNFKWPSGHTRFRYKLHTDGKYRLQTVRYESVELTEEILRNNSSADAANSQDVIQKETTNDVATVIKDSSDSQKSSNGEGEATDVDYNLCLLGEVALSQTEQVQGMSVETFQHVLPPGVYSVEDMDEEYNDAAIGPSATIIATCNEDGVLVEQNDLSTYVLVDNITGTQNLVKMSDIKNTSLNTEGV